MPMSNNEWLLFLMILMAAVATCIVGNRLLKLWSEVDKLTERVEELEGILDDEEDEACEE